MSDLQPASLVALTRMNPVYQRDPHEVLRPLRERCPVARDAQAGTFVVTGYAEARGVLANRRTFRDGARAEAAAVLAFGAYWSAVSYDLITKIELGPATWSSSWERGNITIAESANEVRFPNFIAQDPPIHTAQRKVGIADGPTEVHKVTGAQQHLRDYRDVADPIFPEYSLLHRCRAAEEMYGDPHEVIAAVLETESAP